MAKAPMFRHDFAQISQWISGSAALNRLKELEQWLLPKFAPDEQVLAGFQYNNKSRFRHRDSVVVLTKNRLGWLDTASGDLVHRGLGLVNPDGVQIRSKSVTAPAASGHFRELRTAQVSVGDLHVGFRDGRIAEFNEGPGIIMLDFAERLLRELGSPH